MRKILAVFVASALVAGSALAQAPAGAGGAGGAGAGAGAATGAAAGGITAGMVAAAVAVAAVAAAVASSNHNNNQTTTSTATAVSAPTSREIHFDQRVLGGKPRIAVAPAQRGRSGVELNPSQPAQGASPGMFPPKRAGAGSRLPGTPPPV